MASSPPPESTSVPIVDSHIHLYPSAEVDSLAWCTPDHPLAGQRSVAEFRTATASASAALRGFVFVETDRRNADCKDWTGPLAEVAWAARIIAGKPKPGEGHEAADGKLCLAFVPWAPMPLGKDRVEEYLAQAREAAGEEAWARVKGFRYLLQDKPAGAGLTDGFVEALKLLGRRGFAFDVGVDQHRRGRAQLEECVEMIDRAHDGVAEKDKVVFVLNHLCKPDLAIINTTDPAFIAWRSTMFTLGKASRTYMKLSGCLSEMSDSLKQRSPEDIFEAISPWLAVVLAAFGPRRIMFASDWPVCTVGVGDDAWQKWQKVVERMCDMVSMSNEDRTLLWGGTAREAYGILDD